MLGLGSDGGHDAVTGQSSRPFIVEFPCVNFEITLDTRGPGPFGPGAHCIIYTARDACGSTVICHNRFYVEEGRPVIYCDPMNDRSDVLVYAAGGRVIMNSFLFDDGQIVEVEDPDQLWDKTSMIELGPDAEGDIGFTINASWIGEKHTSFSGSADFPGRYRIWVDADYDGDFYDDGELVYDGESPSGSLTWPAGVLAGDVVRVRFGAGRYDAPEACGPGPYSAYYDMQVIVGGEEPAVAVTPDLTLSGVFSAGSPLLKLDVSAEGPQVRDYRMIRGTLPYRMRRYTAWSAAHRDGQSQQYEHVASGTARSMYYQAIAYDGDGVEIARSNVARVAGSPKKGGGISLFVAPNPASGNIVVERVPTGLQEGHADETNELAPPESDGFLELFDAVGRQVMRKQWPAELNRLPVELPRLVPGPYMLRETRPGQAPVTTRLIIGQQGSSSVPRA